jgi:regulatory protein
VEPQRRNPERVNVYVEGRYAFSLGSLLAVELRLGPGVELAPDLLKDAFRRDTVGKAVEACVRLLSYRPRTEAELLRRLGQKGVEPEIAAEAVERVRALGYVDDAEFACFWVQNREQFKPMGARRLRYELQQKGVDRETARQVLEELPPREDEAALRVGRAKLRTYAGLDEQTFRRRLGGFLARQGFDYETSARVIKALWAETSGEALDGQE